MNGIKDLWTSIPLPYSLAYTTFTLFLKLYQQPFGIYYAGPPLVLIKWCNWTIFDSKNWIQLKWG